MIKFNFKKNENISFIINSFIGWNKSIKNSTLIHLYQMISSCTWHDL